MSLPSAKPLYEANKVHFMVRDVEDAAFMYRGKHYEIDLPEEVRAGDQVVAMINSPHTAVFIRVSKQEGRLKTRLRKRSKKRKTVKK